MADPAATQHGCTVACMATAAASAHLLLQVDPGCADEVAAFLGTLPAVVEAAVTSGPYDVIARIDLTEDSLSRILVLTRRAPGLSAVRVCRTA